MMRTYTRKRPSHQLIDDVHELCRLCLNKALEAQPIFSENSDNMYASLALRIMICVGLEVAREDCLPNIICKECYNELNKYYAFRKKCEVTYQKLKSHVLAVKEKQYKQKLIIEAENKKRKMEEDSSNEGLKFVVTFDKDQYAEVNVLNLNGVAQVNSFAEQKLPDLTKVGAPEITLLDHTTEEELTQEEIPNPDISTFLSTMLVELGILTQQENGIVCSNQNINSLELETGDGSQITLELMEEDDVEEQVNQDVKISIPIETPIITEKVEIPLQENKPIVKYITSKNDNKRKEVKSSDKNNGLWCNECGKRLGSKSALTRHMRIHSGEKPYACEMCGRRFAQKEVMLRHQLVHEERRPHACVECDKSFTQRGALAAHSRSHAAPHARPLLLHRCQRCSKVFLYASGLSRHMMMHNGRVYVCGACERQFKDKSSLLRHLKNSNHAIRDNANT